MNYRHAFHAGNFADVVKHVILTALLERLSRKDKPWCYVETHAGRGCYRLDGQAARRSGESAGGIGRLLDARGLHEVSRGYRAMVLGLAGNERGLKLYPGSPLLARMLMRPEDRAILAELQAEEAAALKALFRGDRRVAVHHMDGYQALKAFLPPEPRRGLVMIDPPYESPGELARLPGAVSAAARRWPTGIFAVWYPIKDRRELAPLMRGLADADVGEALVAELTIAPADSAARLNGSGMVILRPPWRFEEVLDPLLADLAPRLSAARPAATSVRRLAAPTGPRARSGAR
jgi:23S rRNA (adenine2030-N6)-methyltransferase